MCILLPFTPHKSTPRIQAMSVFLTVYQRSPELPHQKKMVRPKLFVDAVAPFNLVTCLILNCLQSN